MKSKYTFRQKYRFDFVVTRKDGTTYKAWTTAPDAHSAREQVTLSAPLGATVVAV